MTTAEERKALANAYLWYDFFGVPQMKARTEGQEVENQLQNAVDSIPAYVQHCKHFVALVPVCPHTDLKDTYCDKATWTSRGWCRAELAVWALSHSKRADRFITVYGEGYILEAQPQQWLFFKPIGR